MIDLLQNKDELLDSLHLKHGKYSVKVRNGKYSAWYMERV